TSLPMLIAEELEVELNQVQVEHASPDDKLFGNRLVGFQVTGGSTSVRAFWEPLRRAGATARTMLVAAAAQNWKVEPASCRAEKDGTDRTGSLQQGDKQQKDTEAHNATTVPQQSKAPSTHHQN